MFLTIPPAHAAFFAVSRAISRADAALEKGIRAEEEGRRKEAFDFYDDALTRFADIHRDHPGPAHYDGDPFEAGTDMDLSILPGALQVIVPVSKRNKI